MPLETYIISFQFMYYRNGSEFLKRNLVDLVCVGTTRSKFKIAQVDCGPHSYTLGVSDQFPQCKRNNSCWIEIGAPFVSATCSILNSVLLVPTFIKIHFHLPHSLHNNLLFLSIVPHLVALANITLSSTFQLKKATVLSECYDFYLFIFFFFAYQHSQGVLFFSPYFSFKCLLSAGLTDCLNSFSLR